VLAGDDHRLAHAMDGRPRAAVVVTDPIWSSLLARAGLDDPGLGCGVDLGLCGEGYRQVGLQSPPVADGHR